MSYQCPVCKSTNLKDRGAQMTCNDCGTTDSIRQFDLPGYVPHDEPRSGTVEVPAEEVTAEFDPLMIFPPQHIIDAVELIDRYFRVERCCTRWAFGQVQSREAPALVGIATVENMAAAFTRDLVPRVSPELVEYCADQACQKVHHKALAAGGERQWAKDLRAVVEAALEAERD